MNKALLDWCKEQAWWQHVHPLIQSGLYVWLHVEDEWPGDKDKLVHRPTGGVLELTRCGVPGWHMALVARPEDIHVAAQMQDENLFRLRDRRHGWGHPAAGDA